MINAATKSTGAMNRDSILSINRPQPQSIKNQGNIMTLIKNTGGTHAPLNQQQPSGQTYNRPSPLQPSGQTQSRPPLQPSGQTQSIPSQPLSSGQTHNRPPRQPQNIQPALTAGQQNTASTPGMPAARPVPTLVSKVQKGQKTQLPLGALTAVEARFGWNVTDVRCDVDVSAFLLGADGKVIGDSWFVF